MSHSPGLFDLDERYAARSRTGDALERLASVVDFEMFRAGPDASLLRSDRSKGRAPADGCGDDVQGACVAKPVRAGGRADRVSDRGPAEFHALSRSRPARAGC